MPRPRDPNKKVALSIRVDPALRKEINRVVKEHDDQYASVSDLVGQAITQHLESRPE